MLPECLIFVLARHFPDNRSRSTSTAGPERRRDAADAGAVNAVTRRGECRARHRILTRFHLDIDPVQKFPSFGFFDLGNIRDDPLEGISNAIILATHASIIRPSSLSVTQPLPSC